MLSALAPLQKNLDELQQKVSNIEEGRKHEMGVLGEQLKGLGEQQARLDRETSSLSAALRNNKVRGAWERRNCATSWSPPVCWSTSTSIRRW